MIRVMPFALADLDQLEVQSAQAPEAPHSAADPRAAALHGCSCDARTVRAPDGTVLVCFGVVAEHAQAMTAWALFSRHAGPWMLAITRWVRAYFTALDIERIDMIVRDDFPEGQRWAVLLGCWHEGTRVRANADGTSQRIYARLKGGR